MWLFIWIYCVQITSKNKIEGNKFVWNSSCVFMGDVKSSEMKMFKQVVGVVFLLIMSSVAGYSATQDSIGTKVKNGKVFILHKVEKSQGLFSISRRYGVSLNEIILANPGSDKILLVDQILLIPTGRDAKQEEQAVTEYFTDDKAPTQSTKKPKAKRTTFAKYHMVAEGETLYSISVLYNTKVDVIKNLNGLETDMLSPGQQLMVPATESEKKDQDEQIHEAEQKMDDASSKLEKLKKAIKPKKIKDDPVVEMFEVKTDKYSVTVEKIPKYNVEKVSETGTAQSMSESEGNASKRVCSHHSASIGSTVMVTNPENNKSVFVKVIANHNLNTETGNIIIISATAAADIELVANSSVNVSFAR
ncbi:MAG: LysM repeat protein [Bacteroidia bacterium]|jgi:LysM repeat protein